MHFQGTRMDDQRCLLPQIKPTENCLSSKKDEGAPRSASFSSKSDTEQLKNKKKDSPKEVYNSATLLKKITLNHSTSALTASTAFFFPLPGFSSI